MKNFFYSWLLILLIAPVFGEVPPKLTPQENYLNKRYIPNKDARKPTLSLIIMDVGISEISESALSELPPTVGLALSPFMKPTPALMEKIKNKGFPLLVQLPWSSGSKFSKDAHRFYNLKALKNLIQRIPGTKGVIYSASTFIPYPSFDVLVKTLGEEKKSESFEIWQPEPPLRDNLLDLTFKYNKRGAVGDFFIRPGDLNYIVEKKLKEVLDLAEKTGFATLCITLPNAATLKRLLNWMQSVEAKVEFVPFSNHALLIQSFLETDEKQSTPPLEK